MRALVQRVTSAVVRVRSADGSDGWVAEGEIGPGLVVLVGVTHGDGPATAERLAEKVWTLRVFEDDGGRMNRPLAETSRAALVCSQFTLYGDTSRGRRPSWVAAAPAEVAEPLVTRFADGLERLGATVARGRFGAHMRLALENDGPVTVMVEL